MQTYTIDLSRLSEEQKGDVSQRLHELQETCYRLTGDGTVGTVYGNYEHVKTLQGEGWDVKLLNMRDGSWGPGDL